MSGEKEVRLRESEYRRLMNAAHQVENEQSRADAIEGQLRQARRQIDEQQRIADRRHQAFERSIGNLSAELQATTRDFHARLTQQSAEFSRRVEQLDKRIAGQRREYLDLIAEQAAHVEQQFTRIAEQQRSARQDASQWLADSQTILDYIEQHQRHQQFAPGELDLLKGELAMSRCRDRRTDAGRHPQCPATRLVASAEGSCRPWQNAALSG